MDDISCLPASLVSFRHHGSGDVIDECVWSHKSTWKILEVYTYHSLINLIITYHHPSSSPFFLTNCWFRFLAERYDFILSRVVRKAQKHFNSYLKFPVPLHIMRSLSLLNRKHHPLLNRCSTGLALGGIHSDSSHLDLGRCTAPQCWKLTKGTSGDLIKVFQLVEKHHTYYNDLQVWRKIVLNKNSPLPTSRRSDLSAEYCVLTAPSRASHPEPGKKWSLFAIFPNSGL